MPCPWSERPSFFARWETLGGSVCWNSSNTASVALQQSLPPSRKILPRSPSHGPDCGHPRILHGDHGHDRGKIQRPETPSKESNAEERRSAGQKRPAVRFADFLDLASRWLRVDRQFVMIKGVNRRKR